MDEIEDQSMLGISQREEEKLIKIYHTFVFTFSLKSDYFSLKSATPFGFGLKLCHSKLIRD